MTLCPCGSGQDLDGCCGPIINGAPAPTAEALKRSRYTAFALGDIGYLADTLSPDIRGDFDQVEAESTANDAKWRGCPMRRNFINITATALGEWNGSWSGFRGLIPKETFGRKYGLKTSRSRPRKGR